MVEDVFINDLHLRGAEVLRSTPFASYSIDEKSNVEAVFDNLKFHSTKKLKTRFLVGCDGAHSKVRKHLLGDARDEHEAQTEKSAWGVLDGVIETDFPDLWSKAVISNEAEGSVLCIPRERNMTRLYIELHPDKAPLSSEVATQEFVMSRAKAIVKPFKLEWKIVGEFVISHMMRKGTDNFQNGLEYIRLGKE